MERNRDKPATEKTKREDAAMVAMQGLLANHHMVVKAARHAGEKGIEWWEQIAIEADTLADALFDELEKNE